MPPIDHTPRRIQPALVGNDPLLQFFFRVDGLDATINKMDVIVQQIKIHITVTLERWGGHVTNEMIATHSFVNRTGRLERSIGYHVEAGAEGRLELHVYALAPYAQPVEAGVPGHSRPYPFFWPVVYKWLPDLYDWLAEAVETALEGAEFTGRLDLGGA